MPVFQAVAFSGTYFGITRLPGFPTDRSINWFLPLAVVMGSSFSGLRSGLAMIRDLESGFYDRLRMSPAPRRSLLLGPLLAVWGRTLIIVTIVFVVGTIAGARLTDGPLGLLDALHRRPRHGDDRHGLEPRPRVPVPRHAGRGDHAADACSSELFLTSAQTPLDVMTGWLHAVARVNPLTNILRLARAGFLGDIAWADCWGGLLAIAGLGGIAMLFARRGLATLDRLIELPSHAMSARQARRR